MNDTTKPEQPNQTTEARSDTPQAADIYDRFSEKSQEIFNLGQEKGLEAWEKAMELARQQMSVAGEFQCRTG